MNKGELRELFKATLNNDECTDTLADLFISQGVRRTERLLRTPMQKSLFNVTIPEGFDGSITLPYDYLALDWIKVNGKPAYRFAPQLGDTIAGLTDKSNGSQRFWYENENMYFSPALATGDVVKFNYYREFYQGEEDGDVLEVTTIIPDVILYHSLVFAAIYFTDDRKVEFEKMGSDLLVEVQTQSDLDELSGGAVISNPYEGYI